MVVEGAAEVAAVAKEVGGRRRVGVEVEDGMDVITRGKGVGI